MGLCTGRPPQSSSQRLLRVESSEDSCLVRGISIGVKDVGGCEAIALRLNHGVLYVLQERGFLVQKGGHGGHVREVIVLPNASYVAFVIGGDMWSICQ